LWTTSSPAKKVGLLGGIVVFCATLLLGLLQDCQPLAAMKKAALPAVLSALVIRLCVQIAFDVVQDGIKRHAKENKT